MSSAIWEQLFWQRSSEPEYLQVSGNQDWNVHLIPSHSYLISLMIAPRLEFRKQLAEEGKKKEEKGGNDNQPANK